MADKTTQQNKGKVLRGTVVSNKMKDTIVVSIDSFKKHPKYGKYIKRQNKIMAHDLGNTKQIGEIVDIAETRPISKRKRFKLITK